MGNISKSAPKISSNFGKLPGSVFILSLVRHVQLCTDSLAAPLQGNHNAKKINKLIINKQGNPGQMHADVRLHSTNVKVSLS